MDLEHATGPPSWLALESVQPLSKASEVTSLSRDALIRNYPELIVRLSPSRLGMKLRDILSIASGRARQQ
jgi:hypothetical protein